MDTLAKLNVWLEANPPQATDTPKKRARRLTAKRLAASYAPHPSDALDLFCQESSQGEQSPG